MDHDRLKLLGIYLQDHLAGAMTGTHLARRILEQNEGNDFGRAMRGVVTEIERDRQALVALVERLGVERSYLKEAIAWLGEKVARLKPNARLRSYSPLSRFIELEALVLGISGKKALWRALDHVADGYPDLERDELKRLMGRADEQREQVEELRLRAAELAFLDGAVEQAEGATKTSPRAPARAT